MPPRCVTALVPDCFLPFPPLPSCVPNCPRVPCQGSVHFPTQDRITRKLFLARIRCGSCPHSSTRVRVRYVIWFDCPRHFDGIPPQSKPPGSTVLRTGAGRGSRTPKIPSIGE